MAYAGGWEEKTLEDYDSWIELEFEMALIQLDWLALGYDGRHAGLWWAPILCHDYGNVTSY